MVITYFLFFILSLVSYDALQASNASSQRGLWLSLGSDEYAINGSVDWDVGIISGGNSPEEDTTFLFVEEALFLRVSKEAGINLTSLKSLKTADTKKYSARSSNCFMEIIRVVLFTWMTSELFKQATLKARNSQTRT